jgi:hypothetical protein
MKEENIEFSIPDNFIEKIYEFSGGADKYKGIILAVCTENGSPTIYSKFDSSIVELGLKKAVSDYIIGEVEEVDNKNR